MPACLLFRRLISVCLGIVVAMTATAGPAAAHDQLVSTQPEAGQRLAEPPTVVRLTFSADVLELGTTVIVRGSDGADLPVGATAVTGTNVEVALPPLAPGDYSVVWRVVSADGHPISGTFDFGVDGPAPSTPSESASSPPQTTISPTTTTRGAAAATPGDGQADVSAGRGPSTVLWAVAGLVLAAIACLLVVGRRARGRDS
jgi:methionine-rich copper-binding protein CopC